MTAASSPDTAAACACGQVVLHIDGPPIVHIACYCKSCQEAGQLIEQLFKASSALGSDGGTDYLSYRKDRVRCTRGGERLKELRLKPDASTRRMIAACCGTAMFLDVQKGHWLTIYRDRIAGSVPPLQARVMTVERRAGVVLSNDVPMYSGRSGKVIGKLMAAWAAMGFRTPHVEGVPERAGAIQTAISREQSPD